MPPGGEATALCATCGTELPAGSRPHRRTCGDACRKRLSRRRRAERPAWLLSAAEAAERLVQIDPEHWGEPPPRLLLLDDPLADFLPLTGSQV